MALPKSGRAAKQRERAAKVPNFIKVIGSRRPHGCEPNRAVANYTTQRPKSEENCGGDIELKARSQPTGTCLPVRTSAGRDGPFFAGDGAIVSRSPLSAQSTTWGLDRIANVLGNDGNEKRIAEQIAITRNTHRATVLRISTSHP